MPLVLKMRQEMKRFGAWFNENFVYAPVKWQEVSKFVVISEKANLTGWPAL